MLKLDIQATKDKLSSPNGIYQASVLSGYVLINVSPGGKIQLLIKYKFLFWPFFASLTQHRGKKNNPLTSD